MTARVDEALYRDAYARQAEARVLEVATADGPPLVVLDATTFYPGGGGQPSDRGAILRTADGRELDRPRRAARRAARSSTSSRRPRTASCPPRATASGSTSTGRAATP